MSNKALEMAPEQFIISKTNPAGKITHCNQGFIEFSGYNQSEITKKPPLISAVLSLLCCKPVKMWPPIQAN
ncbi:MAG: PAS domain-containing protein [Alteromonadaceae bacterium]|jgi:PAS domain-containing protein